nr:conserved hypothetical protein [uncultured bacterium]
MNTNYIYNMRYVLILCLFTASCSTPIEKALNSSSPLITRVTDSIDKYEVQILFTQIDSTDNGDLQFKDYSYGINEQNYFYPASTVKLPVSVLAAEYADAREDITLDTPYIIDGDEELHSISDDLRQIFAVSDNKAYNRLYELLGRDYINSRLREKGYTQTTIQHRLATPEAAVNARKTIQFFPSYTAESIIITNKEDKDLIANNVVGNKKGLGYIENGKLVNEPMDFGLKNHFPLQEQHHFVKSLVFPNSFETSKKFELSETSRQRVLKAMKTLPRDAKYNQEEYYDSYVKFFMYGDVTTPIPDNIHIYNKVGFAYGTLTETAYIEDTQNDIRFIISATILVNDNQIFNDDTYEYEQIGIPFLAQLGREFYEQEKERKE